MQIVNVADLRDPNDAAGRTYRQVNAGKTHAIALGALVELENGARLLVVHLGRDCDQTPLYWLAADMPDPTTPGNSNDEAYLRWHRLKWVGGYSDDSLTVIREPAS